MKRCEICDSSEEIDTKFDHGIFNTKISYWVRSQNEASPHHICSRCWEDVSQLEKDYKQRDESSNTVALDKHVVIDNIVIEDSIVLDDFLEYTEPLSVFDFEDITRKKGDDYDDASYED